MSESKTDLRRRRSASPAAKLRKLGLIVLVAGFAIAGVIYVSVPEGASPEENPLLTEFYDKRELAVQRMWGKEGSLMLSLTESLKHARTYSVLVVVASVLGSFTCFYLARNAYDGSNEAPVKPLPQTSTETVTNTANADQAKRDPGT